MFSIYFKEGPSTDEPNLAAMKITREFLVSGPPETVWAFFSDVPAVAACLPGALLTGGDDENGYQGSLSVKLGPISSTFEGDATIERVDGEMRGVLDGRGVDRRGGNRARVNLSYSLVPHERGTNVAMEAEVTLSGVIAQFGRSGLINEMAARLIGEFVECAEAKLAAPSASEAEAVVAGELKGFSLLLRSLLAWLRKLWRPT